MSFLGVFCIGRTKEERLKEVQQKVLERLINDGSSVGGANDGSSSVGANGGEQSKLNQKDHIIMKDLKDLVSAIYDTNCLTTTTAFDLANCLTTTENVMGDSCFNSHEDELLSTAVYPTLARFNHSCAPNCLHSAETGRVVHLKTPKKMT